MFIAAQLINGISASALLLIYSLGVVVIMGHMNVVNMAHGECIMLGAYVCYYINTVAGAPFFVALIMSFVVTALFGLLIERLVIRKLYGKTAETLLATYALSLIVKQLINLICGSELKYIAIPFEGHFDIGGVKLIILDEPTAGMTAAETYKTGEMIKELLADHTVMVVEHDMDFVKQVAQTVTVLHHGQLLAEGTFDEVEKDPRVIQVYLKDDSDEEAKEA